LLDKVLNLRGFVSPFLVGVIVGIGLLGWGVFGLVRCARLFCLRREEED